MIRNKGEKVPDAWDDDWETQADRAAKEPPKQEPAPVLNKAERMELHRESNRKLWESADNREPFHFLETNNTVPLATGFKPQVKLLSRRPTPARDPSSNVANLSLKDDEEDEQEAIRRHQIEAEARMREGKRLLEEKQKAYEEARRRIFGEDNKEDEGRQGQGQGRGPPNRGRGNRGNGRGRGRGGNRRGGDGRDSDTSRSATSSRSATPSGATRDQHRPNSSRSATPSELNRNQHRQNSSPKPPSILQKPEGAQGQRPGAKSDNGQAAIREPRGPDGSGRGGFGFSRRGAK